MSKLKKCPFCGKYPQTVVDDETEEKFGVKCFNCGGAIYPEKDTLDEAIKAWNKRAGERIKNLPFAQPETHEKRAETHACDLISRQAVLEICDRRTIRSALQVGREVTKLPSAQPEIIHCDECKWGDWYTTLDGHRYCYCMESGNGGRTEADFCSYAERESNERPD